MTRVAGIATLTDVLADLYPLQDDALRIVREAGLSPGPIRWSSNPLNTWSSVLEHAAEHETLALIAQLAARHHPKNPVLALAAAGELAAARGPDPQWRAPEGSFEKIVGDDDLLPVWFLSLGAARAASVARIVRADGERGTGFLVAGGLLITNHHVLPDASRATGAHAEFNVQHTIDGLDSEMRRYPLDPALGFAASADDDWAAVRLGGDDLAQWGAIPLAPAAAGVGSRVTIIQHPAGGPKHVALHDNKVVYVGERRVQYLTDTMPGSSGSPVFDHRWQWVALHHSGGWIREPGSKQAVYRNEGIDAATVVAGLRAAGLVS